MTRARQSVRIGTAGWAIPTPVISEFPTSGSTLARYASIFNATEINSSFRRSHRATTYARWASTTPSSFRFSVKTPKSISHLLRLLDCDTAVESFLDEIRHLGDKLGPLLLQLPPSLAFDAQSVDRACNTLSGDGRYRIACEPRHASWFTPDVDRWLAERRIARVASDPARHPGAGEPGGWRGLSYYRLHGSPRTYYSSYDSTALTALHSLLERDEATDRWCIFDNTASGAAASNALSLAAPSSAR